MNPSTWELAKVLIADVADLSPAERERVLAERCPDSALRRELIELLTSPAPLSNLLLPPIDLEPGAALGPYRIEGLVGRGGMGVVFRAHDTRLDRTVAIKIVPSHFGRSANLKMRFEREARTISQLTHPHICTLYDIGREGEIDFLVMEYLEGETLAARLGRGALPLDETLRIGLEIASALEHAHRAGVVHRDLKPANVMLTRGGAKLLDFGVAKLRASTTETAEATVMRLPGQDTADGALLGTIPYMAPEQISGHSVDARADIWAFGVMLYEMVATRRPFEADDDAQLMKAIVEHATPPLTGRPFVHPLLEHLIRTCLAKDPDDRWQSVADVRRHLHWLRESGTATAPLPPALSSGSQRRRAITAAAVFLVVAGLIGAAWINSGRLASNARPAGGARLSIPISPSGLALVPAGLAISPDGQSVVFAANDGTEQRLYTRRLTESTIRPLVGSERGGFPFFSPGGDWVGFLVSDRGIFKMPLGGGPVEQVYAKAGRVVGATWENDGSIVFGVVTGQPGVGLWSISADGGTPRLVAGITDASAVAYADPTRLPGRRSLLFAIQKGGETSVGALPLGGGNARTIVESGGRPFYSPTGHLLYIADGRLRAIPFDAERLQVRGPSRIVIDDVAEAAGSYAVSATGTLAYVPSSSALKRLAWIDRAGVKTYLNFEPRRYGFPELSPDGRLVALTVEDGAARNIWVGVIGTGTLTRLTFGDDDVYSTFTSDSKDVLFTSGHDGRYNVYSASFAGEAAVRRVTDSPHAQRVTSISPDGTRLLLNDIDPTSALDILQMNADDPASLRPFVKTGFVEMAAQFSPDGHWVAYESDASGRHEIYVTSYPDPGTPRQVSVGGGQHPLWNPRGAEVLYQGPTDIMAVTVSNGLPLRQPMKLFPHAASGGIARDWTVSPDGRRFLVIDNAEVTQSSQINVLLNLFEELDR